jgi:hypothetical protein
LEEVMVTPVVAEITRTQEAVTRDPFIERLGSGTGPEEQRADDMSAARMSGAPREAGVLAGAEAA